MKFSELIIKFNKIKTSNEYYNKITKGKVLAMSYNTKSDLLNKIGKSTNIVEMEFGEASIIISIYGGRVLGVFPKRDCYNLLWTAPNIKDVIEKNEWNIGGDRFWISPERYFFYKKPETWEEWFCPEGLDPADYILENKSNAFCSVSSKISLTNQRTKEQYDGEIIRKISLIKERYSIGIPYCGIEYIEECKLKSTNLNVNGWTLTQIISGGPYNPGTVLIPTNPNPKPLSYFRTIPHDRLIIGEDYVAFKIDVYDIYKLAIRPEDIDYTMQAKIGYVLDIPETEDWGLLVKLSDDVPKSQENCFDVSRDHPDSEIGVIQSYNSETPDKLFLNFGEIELQLNQFETQGTLSHGKATHQLFAYMGTKEDILEVIDKYLGITNPVLF